MDNSIRDHGGVIATQTIKGHAAFKKIPVIYLSANNQIKILTAKAGADAYLEKPFDIKDLEKVINSVISNNN